MHPYRSGRHTYMQPLQLPYAHAAGVSCTHVMILIAAAMHLCPLQPLEGLCWAGCGGLAGQQARMAHFVRGVHCVRRAACVASGVCGERRVRRLLSPASGVRGEQHVMRRERRAASDSSGECGERCV